MEILDSQWFLRMVEAGGKSPAEKLLAIFSISGTWMAAPGIREQFMHAFPVEQSQAHACVALRCCLTDIAVEAGVRHPAVLANQLVILLQGAIAEEIRQPRSGALEAAAEAARLVIAQSCDSRKKERRLRQAMGGMGVAATLAAAVVLYPSARQAISPAPAPGVLQVVPVRAAPIPAGISPDVMEQILVLQHQIETGHCPAPQLLAMPQGQVTAYMDAIQFRTPENPAADRENARAFLEWFRRTRATECYFPPVNGHTAVAWVAKG